MKTIEVRKDEAGMVTQTIITESDNEQNSIKIARNGKGEFSWEMKVYGENATAIQKELVEFRKVADAQSK